jgi:hypothetical protein
MMRSPRVQRQRDFMPPPIRRMDGVLLRRYPLLWSSGLHRNIPIAMVFLALAATVGWTLRVQQLLINQPIIWGLPFVLPSFAIALSQEKRLPEAAARMPERPPEVYARLLLLVLWSAIVSYTPVAFAATAGSTPQNVALFALISAAAGVWTAALMFTSPGLILQLPGLLFVTLFFFEVFFFLVGGAAYGAAYAWNAVVVRSIVAEPPEKAFWLSGALGVVALLGLACRRLTQARAWRLIAVLVALAGPLLVALIAIVANEGDLEKIRRFLFALTVGQLFVLFPALPALRRHWRAGLLTPEQLTVFYFKTLTSPFAFRTPR